ncbi:MAG: hypothetical protein ABSG72_13615 [Candidatus Sulfotelmatobacter sp.]|jgi:hypothetical protein
MGSVQASAVGSKAHGSLPGWVSGSVVLGALLMAAGGLIALIHPAMLISPDAEINGAARVYAGYLVSRNLALAIMLLFALGMRSRRVLGSLMVLTAFIQLLDAAMDCVEGRWPLVPGVVVFAIVFFLGAARLSGQPFWNVAAWRDEA